MWFRGDKKILIEEDFLCWESVNFPRKVWKQARFDRKWEGANLVLFVEWFQTRENSLLPTCRLINLLNNYNYHKYRHASLW